MLYYGSRDDAKTGCRLLTSYSTKRMQTEYCKGENLKLFQGLYLMDFQTGEFRIQKEMEYDPSEEELVRSRIVGKAIDPENIRYVIKKKNKDGLWLKTGFVANEKSYGKLNNVLKALGESSPCEYVIIEYPRSVAVEPDEDTADEITDERDPF